MIKFLKTLFGIGTGAGVLSAIVAAICEPSIRSVLFVIVAFVYALLCAYLHDWCALALGQKQNLILLGNEWEEEEEEEC